MAFGCGNYDGGNLAGYRLTQHSNRPSFVELIRNRLKYLLIEDKDIDRRSASISIEDSNSKVSTSGLFQDNKNDNIRIRFYLGRRLVKEYRKLRSITQGLRTLEKVTE